MQDRTNRLLLNAPIFAAMSVQRKALPRSAARRILANNPDSRRVLYGSTNADRRLTRSAASFRMSGA